MTIVKFAVSNWADDKPARKEYVRETEHFYIHASKRLDSKISRFKRYFDSEDEAVQFIADRKAKHARSKEIDQIKRHAVELLEALEIAEAKLCIAEQHLDLGEDDSISFEHAILTARAAIAKAKGATQ